MNISLAPHEKPSDFVELRLLVKVGANQEDLAHAGYAHFIEHLAFQGTTHFPQDKITEFIHQIGGDFGTHTNAFTGYEHTIYHLSISAEDELLETAIAILRDWATEITFAPDRVESEKATIMEERRFRNTLQDRVQRAYLHWLQPDSLYTQKTPLGTGHSIAQATPEKLKAFYQTWYQPQNMHLMIVGDIQADKMFEKVRGTFSSMKNTASSPRKQQSDIKALSDTPALNIADPLIVGEFFQLLYPLSGPDLFTFGGYQQLFLQTVVQQLLQNRLNQLAEHHPESIISLHSQIHQLQSGQKFLRIDLSALEGKQEVALQHVVSLLTHIQGQGFEERDITQYLQASLLHIIGAYNSRGDRTSALLAQNLVWDSLSLQQYLDPLQLFQLQTEFFRRLEKSDIDKKFREMTARPTPYLAHFSAKPVPESVLIGMYSRAAKQPISIETKAIAATTVKPLLQKKPKGGTILSETFHSEIDTWEWMMSNGGRVFFKQQKGHKNYIYVRIEKRGGSAALDKRTSLGASYMSTFAFESGVGDLTHTELKAALAKHQLNFAYFFHQDMRGFMGQASRYSFDSLMQLSYLSMMNPRFEERKLNQAKTRMLYFDKQSKQNPHMRFMHEFNQFAKVGIEDIDLKQLKKLTVKDFSSLHRDYFAGADKTTFWVVGDIDKDKLKESVSAYWAPLPKGHVEKTPDPILRASESGQFQFYRDYATEDKASILLYFSVSPEQLSLKDIEGMDHLEHILIRQLRTELRDKRKGIYSHDVTYQVSLIPEPHVQFHISFVCDPARQQELIQAAKTVISNIRSASFPMIVLDDEKKRAVLEREALKQRPDWWLNSLLTLDLLGADWQQLNQYPQRVEGLSIEQVAGYAEAFLVQGRQIEAVLSPAQLK